MRTQTAIRKAAVLVAILSPEEADRLLEQFEPHDARRLRDMAVDLGPVDPQEEQRVLEEFFRIGPLVPEKQPPGLELGDHLARPSESIAHQRTPGFRPFHFLQDAEADKLARALAGERAQTVALVLSHLSAEQAGAVLVRLEPNNQVEVLRCLVELEEIDPEILHEVEQALQTRLAEQVQMQRRRVAGLRAVAGIVQGSPEPIGMQIFRNLAARDPTLAERLSPEPIAFEDLEGVDSRSWAEIAAAVDPELLGMALLEASPPLIERVLGQMSTIQANQIRVRLEHPGPTRLSDVEEARRRVADAAWRLALQGRIELVARASCPCSTGETPVPPRALAGAA